MIFHCLNRGNDRRPLFDDAGDYASFERALAATLDMVPCVRLLGYCLMPGRWHLLLWPAQVLGEMAVKLGADRRLRVVHIGADSDPGHASSLC